MWHYKVFHKAVQHLTTSVVKWPTDVSRNQWILLMCSKCVPNVTPTCFDKWLAAIFRGSYVHYRLLKQCRGQMATLHGPYGQLATLHAPYGHLATLHWPYGQLATLHGPYGQLATLHGPYWHLATLHGPYGQLATLHGPYGHLATLHGPQSISAHNTDIAWVAYMPYRTANLQTLHFKYLFNKYPYWIFYTCCIISVFLSSKCRLFHNATLFGSCIIHILNTGCAQI
jgi:hypothetical protein